MILLLLTSEIEKEGESSSQLRFLLLHPTKEEIACAIEERILFLNFLLHLLISLKWQEPHPPNLLDIHW